VSWTPLHDGTVQPVTGVCSAILLFSYSASPARSDGRARIEHEKGPIEADAVAAGICRWEP